jgi:hypothetical protein
MAGSIDIPPAWDFKDGRLRIWRMGEIVAVFQSDVKPNLVLDLVKEMRKEHDKRD